MDISFDPVKRQQTLVNRSLDFARANEVIDGEQVTRIDDRFDYGEVRYITFGYLDEREVVVIWTERNGSRRIISMRRANQKEREQYDEEN